MNKSIIPYQAELPEIPDREPHLRPQNYLRKSHTLPNAFQIVDGRRPSNQLLVTKLRDAVDRWRESSYPGASAVTKRLFNYWFEEDHLIQGAGFRYYFGQREAVETLAYLYEIEGNLDFKTLEKFFSEPVRPNELFLALDQPEYLTSNQGSRQIRRYFPDQDKFGVQDIPPDDLRRYAFKMATGSGKTMVMAMIMVWSYFHRKLVPGSALSTNFLVLAPNVIVYERLRKDFSDGSIFKGSPLVPPEWDFSLQVILRDDASIPNSAGNLFLTNIHQLYSGDTENDLEPTPIQELLGPNPEPSVTGGDRDLLERINQCEELIVINDEAHHVHQEDRLWNRILTELHNTIEQGLSFWLDFSATPKDQNGTYFSWIVCDYPLAQAIEDGIVKAPLIVHMTDKEDPDHVTADNVVDIHEEWLVASISRLREHENIYSTFGVKPVLFIMAEKSQHADAIGKWLVETKALGFSDAEVLVIHTDSTGEITKKDLETARVLANTIDAPSNDVKVIVSVLMLREGWDVRNVTVALGLRPFNSAARILPEQAIGRGLRLIQGAGLGNTQTLEVMGTTAFEDFVRSLEVEGVGIETTTAPPSPPITVMPMQEKMEFDIGIPITSPIFINEYRKLEDLDPLQLPPIGNAGVLEQEYSQKLEMEFMTTETIVHQEDLDLPEPPIAQILIASICNRIAKIQGLPNVFSSLYPKVLAYMTHRCFGRTIDVDDVKVRSHLRRPELQSGVAKFLSAEISALTTTTQEINFENKDFRLSSVKPFAWRRQHLVCRKTVFNYVASYNGYESAFGSFLDRCPDIVKFSALATTGQGANGQFRVNYVGKLGAIRFYYPDWVAVQSDGSGLSVNWIIETKGRLWDDTTHKDKAIKYWCDQISTVAGETWRYIRVNQDDFDAVSQATSSFAQLLDSVEPSDSTT